MGELRFPFSLFYLGGHGKSIRIKEDSSSTFVGEEGEGKKLIDIVLARVEARAAQRAVVGKGRAEAAGGIHRIGSRTGAKLWSSSCGRMLYRPSDSNHKDERERERKIIKLEWANLSRQIPAALERASDGPDFGGPAAKGISHAEREIKDFLFFFLIYFYFSVKS